MQGTGNVKNHAVFAAGLSKFEYFGTFWIKG